VTIANGPGCPHTAGTPRITTTDRPAAKDPVAGRLGLKSLSCGTELPSGAKYCKECGQAVSKPALSAAKRFGSPDSYTPRHLAERILTSKATLEVSANR
jgi:hypothetical protein